MLRRGGTIPSTQLKCESKSAAGYASRRGDNEIMMIMMSFVAGDDDTCEKTESERAWGENKPWALSQAPALSQSAKDCSKHGSSVCEAEESMLMCMSQVCSNTAVWKHAKYGINTSTDTNNRSKLCLKLLTADHTRLAISIRIKIFLWLKTSGSLQLV